MRADSLPVERFKCSGKGLGKVHVPFTVGRNYALSVHSQTVRIASHSCANYIRSHTTYLQYIRRVFNLWHISNESRSKRINTQRRF